MLIVISETKPKPKPHRGGIRGAFFFPLFPEKEMFGSSSICTSSNLLNFVDQIKKVQNY